MIESEVRSKSKDPELKIAYKSGTISDISKLIDKLASEIFAEDSSLTCVKFYEALAEKNPERISRSMHIEAVNCLVSSDVNVARDGKKVLLFTNMKSVLAGTEKLRETNKGMEDEIVQAGIVNVLRTLNNLTVKYGPSQQIYRAAEHGAAIYIAQEKDLPIGLVLEGVDLMIEKELAELGDRISYDEIREIAQKISPKTDISPDVLRHYFLERHLETIKTIKSDKEENSPLEQVSSYQMVNNFKKILSGLSRRERFVLKNHFGLSFSQTMTLEEIGVKLGLGKERVRQIEYGTIEKLWREQSGELRSLRDLSICANPSTYRLESGYVSRGVPYSRGTQIDLTGKKRDMRQKHDIGSAIPGRFTERAKAKGLEIPQSSSWEDLNAYRDYYHEKVKKEEELARSKEQTFIPMDALSSDEKAELEAYEILGEQVSYGRVEMRGRSILVRQNLSLEKFLDVLHHTVGSERVSYSRSNYLDVMFVFDDYPITGLFTDGIVLGRDSEISTTMIRLKEATYIAEVFLTANSRQTKVEVESKLLMKDLRKVLKKNDLDLNIQRY